MSPRKQHVLAFIVRLLGLLMIVIDLLKSGRTIGGVLPQTPAWDAVNNLVYVSETFVGYNVGKLLPGHGWSLLGVALFLVGTVLWRRARRADIAQDQQD